MSYQDPNGPTINPEIQKDHFASYLLICKTDWKISFKGEKEEEIVKAVFMPQVPLQVHRPLLRPKKSLLFGLRRQNSKKFAALLTSWQRPQ